MSDTRNARNTGKRKKMLDNIHSELNKNYEKNQCDCLHTRKGELNIVPSQRRKSEGQLCYVCKLCAKELTLNQVPQKTTVKTNPQNPEDYKVIVGYEDAVSQLDSMCDVIKMSLNMEKPKDARIAERISETQYRIRNNIVRLYQASLNKNKTGNQGNGNGRQRSSKDSAWGQPQVDGRY